MSNISDAYLKFELIDSAGQAVELDWDFLDLKEIASRIAECSYSGEGLHEGAGGFRMDGRNHIGNMFVQNIFIETVKDFANLNSLNKWGGSTLQIDFSDMDFGMSWCGYGRCTIDLTDTNNLIPIENWRDWQIKHFVGLFEVDGGWEDPIESEYLLKDESNNPILNNDGGPQFDNEALWADILLYQENLFDYMKNIVDEGDVPYALGVIDNYIDPDAILDGYAELFFKFIKSKDLDITFNPNFTFSLKGKSEVQYPDLQMIVGSFFSEIRHSTEYSSLLSDECQDFLEDKALVAQYLFLHPYNLIWDGLDDLGPGGLSVALFKYRGFADNQLSTLNEYLNYIIKTDNRSIDIRDFERASEQLDH
jgi:hypothetical protein